MEEVAGGGGQELTAALVAIAFGGQSETGEGEAMSSIRQKRAVLLLEKMLGRVLDKILGGSWSSAPGQLGWLGCTDSLSADMAANWAVHAIR